MVKKGELETTPSGAWRITEKGERRAKESEIPLALLTPVKPSPPSHDEIKQRLVEIGKMLGKYALSEHQRYDVVWKETPSSPRLSHVFEVQDKGNLAAALARLKHAYDTQRSRPFLIVVGEREQEKVQQLVHPFLEGYFHELSLVLILLAPEDVERTYRALSPLKELLEKLILE